MNARLVPLALLLAFANPVPSLADGIGTDSIEASGTSFPARVAGSGRPVIFVHGLFVDNRAWDGFEDAVASSRQFVAYTQRGFGTAAWEDATFTRDRHTEDLVAILRALDGPSDLVGWSYAGPIVLRAAIEAPNRVGRIVLYEPYVPEMLGGTPEADAAGEAFWPLWDPVGAAVEAGDDAGALKLAIEAANGLPAGGFAGQDPMVQEMQLDNKQTVGMQWNAPEPTAMTCEELGTLRAPTLIVTGSKTDLAFTEMGKAVAACIPASTAALLNGSGHEAPVARAPGLIAMTLDFLEAP